MGPEPPFELGEKTHPTDNICCCEHLSLIMHFCAAHGAHKQSAKSPFSRTLSFQWKPSPNPFQGCHILPHSRFSYTAAISQ